jgi:hypothetical protein
MHHPGITTKKHRGLAGAVAATNDDGVRIPGMARLDFSRGIIDAAPFEGFETIRSNP